MTAQRFVQYHQRVLETDPIAYWLLDEKQGLVAYDRVSGRAAGAQNGTHTGVTLYQSGIGDGRASPSYDGVNDYTNVFSAAFAAAFNGSEGTVLCWARVSGAPVWTDGVQHNVFRFGAAANDYVEIYKAVFNNRLAFVYVAGGVAKNVQLNGVTETDWMHLGVTWSISAGANGEMRAYYGGAQTGLTQVALGAWAGVLANNTNVIGALTTAPLVPWNGYIAHFSVWDRPLPPLGISELAVIE